MIADGVKFLFFRVITCAPSWIAIPLIARGLGDQFGAFGAWLGTVAVIGVTVFGVTTSAPVTLFASGVPRSSFPTLHRISLNRFLRLMPLAILLDKVATPFLGEYPGIAMALLAAGASALYQVDLETSRLFEGPSGYGRVVLRRTLLAGGSSLLFPWLVPIKHPFAAMTYFVVIQLIAVNYKNVLVARQLREHRGLPLDGLSVGSAWARTLAAETVMSAMTRWVAVAALPPALSTAYALSLEIAQRYVSVALQTVSMPFNHKIASQIRLDSEASPNSGVRLTVIFVPVLVGATVYMLSGEILARIYANGTLPESGFASCAAMVCGGAAVNRLRKSLFDPYLVHSSPMTLYVMTASSSLVVVFGAALAWLIPERGIDSLAIAYASSQIISGILAYRGIEAHIAAARKHLAG